jgi:type VI secretion system protein ImpF
MPPASNRPDPNQGLMPSIIDRLIDPDSGGTSWRRGYSAEQMIDAVRRDLEDLLNTRQSHQGLPEDFTEVHRSVIAYGLPDLTSLNAITPQQREDIGRTLESIIERFEPRLKDIRAHMVNAGDGKERSVKFHVEARLNLDPAPEVAFDTVLELATGHYSVSPGS